MNTTNIREQGLSACNSGNNEPDMETMRRQMDILRQKLSRQEIVNESLIRQSMRHNMNRINRRHLWLCLLCLLMIPYAYLIFVMKMGFSILFWGYTTLMMLVVMGYTLYMNLHLRADDVLGRDLLVAQQQVARARRLEYDWLKIGVPLLALWIAFICYEVFRTIPEREVRLVMCCTLCIGIGIGLILGFSIRHKALRQYQELADSIEELTRAAKE